MPQPVVIVTGANGQLGKELMAASAAYSQFQFVFLSKKDLAIDQLQPVQAYFKKSMPAFCINCAAYTTVDKAETEQEAAMRINADATGLLASVCKSLNTRFIHISTDYVFDGTATAPYKETDPTNPVNYYGLTKLRGEQMAMANNKESVIIRTSWVYSEYGNNFVKTMIRLMKEKERLNVVNDQLGSPTYAADLAKAILDIIAAANANSETWIPGIYHYSNEGVISWYDFAVAIKTLTGSNCHVNPIPASAYPTPARRPAYSVLNKQKITSAYNVDLKSWMTSLKTFIQLKNII